MALQVHPEKLSQEGKGTLGREDQQVAKARKAAKSRSTGGGCGQEHRALSQGPEINARGQ